MAPMLVSIARSVPRTRWTVSPVFKAGSTTTAEVSIPPRFSRSVIKAPKASDPTLPQNATRRSSSRLVGEDGGGASHGHHGVVDQLLCLPEDGFDVAVEQQVHVELADHEDVEDRSAPGAHLPEPATKPRMKNRCPKR